MPAYMSGSKAETENKVHVGKYPAWFSETVTPPG